MEEGEGQSLHARDHPRTHMGLPHPPSPTPGTTNVSIDWGPTMYDPYHGVCFSIQGLGQQETSVSSTSGEVISEIPLQPQLDGTNPYHLEPPKWKLDYLDFAPDSFNSPGYLAGKCTAFRDLVNQANEWLKQNPMVKVRSCETVVRPGTCPAHVTNTESMLYAHAHPHQDQAAFHVQSLRLWVSPSTQTTIDQIAYRDFAADETDTLQHLMRKVNRSIEETPMEGKLLSCETIHISSAQDSDPEVTVWSAVCEEGASQRLCCRIFYLSDGSTSEESIGVKSFCPDVRTTTPGAAIQVIRRATSWTALEKSKRVLNIKTAYVPFIDRECPENNAERCFQPLPNFSQGEYLQVIRVFYAEPTTPQLPRSGRINCRIFSPVQYHPDPVAQYENMRHTMIRAAAWLEASGAEVFSAESFLTPFQPLSYPRVADLTHWVPPVKCAECRVILHIRIYTEGDYVEPDPRDLPPLPMSTTICETLARQQDQRRRYLEKRKKRKRKKLIIALTSVILVIVGMVIFLDQTLGLIEI